MARIPEEEIGRLKEEVRLEELVRKRGVELRQHGADLVGRCPFHDDREPSLVVSPRKNLWHCLGACRTGGSVIDWVMKAEGVSFRHAVELLKNGTVSSERKPTVKKLAPPVERDADDEKLLGQVADYYHETLKNSPEALKYLAKRGLVHPEMINHFRLGFANRTLGYRLPDKNRAAGAEMRGKLQKLGILRESGHEHFNGSIVIPVFSREGVVVEMYGRKINDNLREGTPVHLYLPGEHRGVFNEEALEAAKEIILCESLIDALTFWCAGYRNVTASYGINGFTGEHRSALEKYKTRKVWIAYDRDEAGDSAAETLAEELIAMGIETRRVLFPHGKDANDCAGSLAELLNGAEWIGGKPATKKEEAGTPVVQGDEVVLTFEDRRYRVRGLAKNLSYDLLRVNLLASRGDAFHVDTLDLYAARQRALFVKQAALEMGIKEDLIKRDLGRLLLKLEERQDAQIKEALEVKAAPPSMTDAERAEALELLKEPKLLDRILADFDKCGVVGEETNKLVGYIAAVSRRLESPLAVVVQSSSAAGKSSLMEAVLAFVPEEERVQYSAMTGQSLFYMGETDLKHKVLAIVEEEGASRAAYALKLLQSEGSLTIASTGKDPHTGKLITHGYRVEGPVMIFLTTTAIHLDEELLNRCLVLSVNEDRAQTQAIHRLQRERETLEGLIRKREREAILKRHRNAQRLLQPLAVVNPYAKELTFFDSLTRMRRDHMKYLALIRAIALLHQHQRPIKIHEGVSYIEATLDDIAMANKLAHEVLGRSLDELPPQTRRLLLLIGERVTAECQKQKTERSEFRFSRRDVREWTGWGNTQLKIHLHRLEEMEYLLVHRGGRGQSFVYELVFEQSDNPAKTFFPGLAGVESLKPGSSRPQAGPVSANGRYSPTPINTGLGGRYAAAEA